MNKSSGHEKAPSVAALRASGNEINFGEEIVMSDNSTNVVPFNFGEQQVRTLLIAGEPWFVAADVCRVLEVGNTTQAVQALDEDERSMFSIGRQGNANLVNESGLYTLILRSRDAVKKGSKPHAFRKWVTAEVLPSIRKAGSYEDRQAKNAGGRRARSVAVNLRSKLNPAHAGFWRFLLVVVDCPHQQGGRA